MGCQASLIVDTNCPKKRTMKKLGTQNSFSDFGRVGEGGKSRGEYQDQRQIQTTQPQTIYVKSAQKPQPQVFNFSKQFKNNSNNQQQTSQIDNKPQQPQPSQQQINTHRAQNLSQSSHQQQFSQQHVNRQQFKQMSMNVSRPTQIINQGQQQKKKPLNNISMNRGQASSERKLHVEDHMNEQNYYNSHSGSSNNLNSNNVSSNASSQSLTLPQFNSYRELHLN